MMPTIKDSSSIEEVLQYIVACYGTEIYQEKQRLSNLIADLYTGEERLKRLYRRMVMEDAVSQQLYAISLKPIQEREGFYNRLLYQFKEANFLEEAFAWQVLDAFLHGMNLLLVEPISTVATEEDGKWVDEYGVMYSADRKKLIRAQERLSGDYSVLGGTVVICDKAFRWCEILLGITLPSSVTSIGKWIFSGCWNLKEINVAESNKFYRTIDGVLYTKDLKTIIRYPQGKENENFVIPSGVTSIGELAFSNCIDLQKITLPSSVTNIGERAFSYCNNLQEITLPSGVTSIGDFAFVGCDNLQGIKVTENNRAYKAIDGVLYTKDSKTIICYPKGKEDVKFVIPSSVTNIGFRAFSTCSNLQEINIPTSVISIGNEAFSWCQNLCKIILPSSVTSIGNAAFYRCENLCEITLPSSVTSIGKYVFCSCSNLRKIILPFSITNIGKEVFDYCPNLEQINIPAGTLEKFKKLLPNEAHLLHEI